MDYDVVIIGGGPSGLATAIKLAQTFKEKNLDKSICVLEKSAEIGGHILSGNVFETTALDELIPDWKEKGAPLDVKVKRDAIKFLINDKYSYQYPITKKIKKWVLKLCSKIDLPYLANGIYQMILHQSQSQ